MLPVRALRRYPDANTLVEANSIQDIVGGLFDVEWLAPPGRGHDGRVAEVCQVESDFIGAICQPAPDLDEAIVLASGGNICGIVGERGVLDRARELLLPYTFRFGFRSIQREGAGGDEKLLRAAPG